MPHSARKKRPPTHQKRREVTDDHGWTHITTGQNARKALRQTAIEAHGSDRAPRDLHADHDIIDSVAGGGPVRLVPAEAPRALTHEELAAQFQRYRTTWEGSATWSTLRDALRRHGKRWRRRGRRGTAEAPDAHSHEESHLEEGTPTPLSNATSAVDSDSHNLEQSPPPNIVCLGLGSVSGLLRGGWVDRRNVSLYQLAALVSIIEFFDTDPNEPAIKAYAQDPVFNALDKTLLSSPICHSITVLDHPAAFDKIHSNTFLFCPGAEKVHLEQILLVPTTRRPALLFGGPLEDSNTGSEILNRFLEECGSVKMERFEPLEQAFWDMRFYWRREEDEEDQGRIV